MNPPQPSKKEHPAKTDGRAVRNVSRNIRSDASGRFDDARRAVDSAVLGRDHEISVRTGTDAESTARRARVANDRVTRFYLQSLSRRLISDQPNNIGQRLAWQKQAVELLGDIPTDVAARRVWRKNAVQQLGKRAVDLLGDPPADPFAFQSWRENAVQQLGERVIRKLGDPPADPLAFKSWRENAVQQLGKQPTAEISRGVCGCLRWRVSNTEPVGVLHVAEKTSAHYGNLQRCGNVWLCAVCGGVVSERRRLEMTEALERSPYIKVLVTFTVRHNLNDPLEEMRDAYTAAIKSLKEHRQYKAMMKRLGMVGTISNVEVLDNEDNGWHLHGHVIMLFKQRLPQDELALLDTQLRVQWLASLKKHGRDADWMHGVDVRQGDSYVQEYLAKFDRLPKATGWTVEHELTKGAVKKSALRGRTAYELLTLYGQGDEAAGKRWLEFARAMKGAHQLQWSRGLKQLLGVVEKSDEELLLEEREEATLLATLTPDQWKVVCGNDQRAELLNVASTGDFEALRVWLQDLNVSILPPTGEIPHPGKAVTTGEIPHSDDEPSGRIVTVSLKWRDGAGVTAPASVATADVNRVQVADLERAQAADLARAAAADPPYNIDDVQSALFELEAFDPDPPSIKPPDHYQT